MNVSLLSPHLRHSLNSPTDLRWFPLSYFSSSLPIMSQKTCFCVWGMEALWWHSGDAAGWRGRWFIRDDLSWKAWITERAETLWQQDTHLYTHTHTHMTWPLSDPIEPFQITQRSQWPHMLDTYSSWTNMITTVCSLCTWIYIVYLTPNPDIRSLAWTLNRNEQCLEWMKLWLFKAIRRFKSFVWWGIKQMKTGFEDLAIGSFDKLATI